MSAWRAHAQLPARARDGGAPPAHAAAALSAAAGPLPLDPDAVATLQRTVGNLAVMRVLADRLGAAGTLQRHTGHDPALAKAGTSERRQHYERAAHLLQTKLADLPLARQEFIQAGTHGPDPAIQAWITWCTDTLGAVDVARQREAKAEWKQVRQGWLDVQKRLTDKGLGDTNGLVQEVAGLVDATRASQKPEKAAKFIGRALKLLADGNYLHAAVQFERAYQFQPNESLVPQIADAYRRGGDKQRAALWYRKALDKQKQPPKVRQRAQAKLKAMGKRLTAKFTTLKQVSEHYSEVDKANLTERGAEASDVKGMKRTGQYAEEMQTNLLSGSLNSVLLELLQGKRTAADVPAIQDFIRYNFGVKEATLEQLLVEFARWQLASRPGIVPTNLLADVQAVFPSVTAADLKTGSWDTLQNLVSAKVKYLKTSKDREPYKLVKQGGKIKQGKPPKPKGGYDTGEESTNASGQGFAIFVMSADGDIYAASHQVDRFHHSSFLAGGATAGAGEIKVESGELTEISNKSGHYQPGPEHLVQSIQGFKKLGGVDGARVRYHSAQGKIEKWTGGPSDFEASQGDAATFKRRLGEEVVKQGGWKK